MYGYVYITRNLINKKYYIGQHKKTYFDEKYHGSGKLLKRAIQKYGIENFRTSMICVAKDKDELNEREKFYIDYMQSMYQYGKGYNISIGGDGGHILENASDEVREKRLATYRVQNKGSRNPNFGNGDKIAGDKNPSKRPDVREKISKKLSGENNPMYGKHRKFPNRVYNNICRVCGTSFNGGTWNASYCDIHKTRK